jgi:hypothetical protein
MDSHKRPVYSNSLKPTLSVHGSMPIYIAKHLQGTTTNSFASITPLIGTRIMPRPANSLQVSLVVPVTARLALAQILCLLALICRQSMMVFLLEMLRILMKLFRNGGVSDGWPEKMQTHEGSSTRQLRLLSQQRRL